MEKATKKNRRGQLPLSPPQREHQFTPAPAVEIRQENHKPIARPESNINYNSKDTAAIREVDNKNIAAQTFAFRELATATKNFRRECLIGEGGFGRVYKGKIEKSGQVVAVKQLDRNGLQGNREFLVEVLMLSLLHHHNLVNLIGYCADGDQRLLVYEYMPMGSLEDHLLDLSPKQKPLDWATRMKIALGAAKGLEYLHDTASPPVIYRDLKSSNILLDNFFNAKLSDFGLAKLGPVGDKSHVSSRVMGTYGYCAPEYQRTGQLTVKSDVYSFGVVLLELISGRRAIDTTKSNEEQNLVAWAQPVFKEPSRFPELADPLLRGEFPVRCLNQAVAVAAMCLQEEAAARPLISDVVSALNFLGDGEGMPAPLPVPPQPNEESVKTGDKETCQDEEGIRARQRAVAEAIEWGANSRDMSCFACFSSEDKKEAKRDRLRDQESASPHRNEHHRVAASPPRETRQENYNNREAPESNIDDNNNITTKEAHNNQIAAQSFAFRELAAATKNFRQESLIGEGGFGRVYKGKLEKSGQVVAVKQLDRNGLQGNEEFLNEVLMLSNLHHHNLVNLIGYCADGEQRLLVYEYMPLGSLEDHLLELSTHTKPLDWFTRMKIALGAAKGLQYLHEEADPPVIYRDLKSSNILLDNFFNAKLSDFGLAKLGPLGEKSHVSSRVMGTYGYCAPEYQRTGQLTAKSDIYSFGVVLLELVTGRRAIDTSRSTEEENLITWAQPIFRDPSRYPELADPLLDGNFPTRSLNEAVAVASMCLQEEASARPLIGDVVNALSFIEEEQDIGSSSD
ncbi:hypothetical protein Tsubulata_026592 [Turnera subulata]|uniref:non-specific serine/threonine protein kinase n=1 Tax=Turnera subulata TaxID=218843 RepID=A0A9Q0JIG0_9ROSI|nr:hypothetical protein Tsubulata_026592 [Turnera subulata]